MNRPPIQMRFLLLAVLFVTVRPAQAAARPDHVVVVILENHAFGDIIGSPAAPYLNCIAASGALLTNSHAVEHPSQPNYLDLFSGSNQGVTTDVTPRDVPFSTPNLGASLLAAGFTFATFSESLPFAGFTGDSFTTVPGQNQYVRKHNPAVNWQAADAPEANHLSPLTNQPFAAFPTTAAGFATLPTVSLVVPNEQHDMHDGTVAVADAWLAQNIEPYRAWAATHDSLLLVTFDEDDHSSDNHIYTVFNGQGVIPGSYTEAKIESIPGAGVDHFNILRNIEDLYAVAPLNPATDGARQPISDIFPGQALNLSTRLNVLTGDNVLIGGFIITGTAPKKVLVRALGPSVPLAGTKLADPTLELHQPDGSIVSNDNWKVDAATAQSQEAEISATTLAPPDDLEAATVQTLAPGSYTAIVRGKDGGTGIGLVEAYDLDASAPAALANLSTRGFVDVGDNVLIGGFIIGPAGRGNASVVVRALGPSLAQSGITDALADPVLELRDENGGTFTNDDWQNDPNAGDIPPGLQPGDPVESATFQTLAAGAYTVIVRGKGSAPTGVGLVETYVLP
jgi:acid phosphatase